ncbi:transketolase [Streptomyces piniterrae]|uniref:Dihydrolipoamide acetyltransferase component of pyruvate dehydrogenase complex n=1 Tax=Streptomyces piniterrae TaxID=2571125 RepID=A0A4V5MI58_9ACTN|nr:2-oxo acid dehydrogenase subunit E2 [Streptomyces piniterrae]TJZ44128.1 transketolase [Streptomyces piniterrae]
MNQRSTLTRPGGAPRVSGELNRALHSLFSRSERLYFLGEDISDPYGGAFKVSKGLSTAYPDRVIATPLSEGGITGVANGLALCGNQVIVEIMFGDFLALAFDQLLNFTAKSVSMYGQRVPMHLLVRCPVGGNRGYGPTHSQSPQKHFIGIPNLALYELSPFHAVEPLLTSALGSGTPGILFEDKVLYTRRMYRDGRVDEVLRYEMTGGTPGWAHVFPDGRRPDPDVVILAPGGAAQRAVEAARSLYDDRRTAVHVLVPGRLHPLDLDPVLPTLRAAGRVAVVEEGTADGTWGSHVATLLYERLWPDLRHPVLQLSSADSVIPTAPHLEREVLLGPRTIAERVAADGLAPAHPASGPEGTEPLGTSDGETVTAPKLNNNDTEYRVVEWLVADGAWVEPDTEIVALETSKAVEDIVATSAGHLHHVASVGSDVGVGAVLGRLLPAPRETAPAPAPDPMPETGPVPAAAAVASRHPLSRAQLGTAAVVTRSHREVPAAFTVMRVDMERALDRLADLGERTGAAVGPADALVKAVAMAHTDFPLLYGTLADARTVALADAPRVGVTIDAGPALYVPVVRDAEKLPVADVADHLMDLRMKAFRQSFTAAELDGANITVSLNQDPGVVLVQPIVQWPQLCMVSLGAVQRELVLEDSGAARERRWVNLGLAYDHRVVNGSDAVRFLTRLRTSLEDEDALASLTAE